MTNQTTTLPSSGHSPRLIRFLVFMVAASFIFFVAVIYISWLRVEAAIAIEADASWNGTVVHIEGPSGFVQNITLSTSDNYKAVIRVPQGRYVVSVSHGSDATQKIEPISIELADRGPYTLSLVKPPPTRPAAYMP